MRAVIVIISGFLSLISIRAFGYPFEGQWQVVAKECFENGRPFGCDSSFQHIEISYTPSSETLCIRYHGKEGEAFEECLNSFDHSKPELGLIFRAELTLLSESSGALYKMTQGNSMEETIQGRAIEKNGEGRFTLLNLLQVENKFSGTIHRQEEIYFLESPRRLPKAAKGLLKGVDLRNSF